MSPRSWRGSTARSIAAGERQQNAGRAKRAIEAPRRPFPDGETARQIFAPAQQVGDQQFVLRQARRPADRQPTAHRLFVQPEQAVERGGEHRAPLVGEQRMERRRRRLPFVARGTPATRRRADEIGSDRRPRRSGNHKMFHGGAFR
jgi:hypothetical protein